MGKIKLNLVSGGVVEKPLINAFSANNANYVVLDNEINGSMGLPIILVCKLENNKLVKVIDPNEWQVVKDILKNIIAGQPVTFIPLAPELSADDIYYTQLTLPVPSFDALKNAYKLDNTSNVDTQVEQNSVVPPVAPINVEAQAVTPSETIATPNAAPMPNVAQVPPVTNNVDVMPQPVQEPQVVNPVTPPVPPVSPVEPNVVPNVVPSVNNVDTPVTNVAPNVTPNITPNITPEAINVVDPEAPVVPIETINTAVQPQPVQPPVTPVSPVAPSTSTISATPVSPVVTEELFKDQKEAFLQACENMFEALVQKFEKELENRK